MLFVQLIDFLHGLAAPVGQNIEFFHGLAMLFAQLIEFLHGLSNYGLQKDQKSTKFAKFEKVFFTEKTRAADVQNQFFLHFFDFLSCRFAEKIRLASTFLCFLKNYEWPFARKNSSGGHFFSKKIFMFLLQSTISTRVFTAKNHFLTHRKSISR